MLSSKSRVCELSQKQQRQRQGITVIIEDVVMLGMPELLVSLRAREVITGGLTLLNPTSLK